MPAPPKNFRIGTLLIFVLAVLLFSAPVHALTPDEVLVVANRNAAKSRGLASFYMKQRGIPEENLVLVWVTDQEICTREEYNRKIAPPIRRFLAAHPHIRALATIYGLPIRIAIQPGDTRKQTTGAALDSELALVMNGGYTLRYWQPNPFYYGFKNRPHRIPKENVMMVGRLDGPDAATVKRMILDSIAAEKNGLSGKAYIDARWPCPPSGKKLTGYALYDASLHHTADFLEKNRGMSVVLNDSKDLFRPGTAPKTALYCGWYSLTNYIDAFQWQRGSVGFHMASGECTTLRGDRNLWCKRILENGAAATIGPVAEPYIQAFPVPELFFNLLSEGILTLAEAYTVSLPYLSWQMMLVGDPLYRVNLKTETGKAALKGIHPDAP